MQPFTVSQLSQNYQKLLSQYHSGQITYQQFITETQKLQAQDEQGNWWTINPENGLFLRYEGNQWVPASPPIKTGTASMTIPPATAGEQARKATSSYILRYRKGMTPWSEYPISGEIIIGRSHDCNLRIEDGSISRHHARLSVKTDGIWFTDLGSSNGSKVDGLAIPPNIPRQVKPGQLLSIGDTSLSIEMPGIPLPQGEESPTIVDQAGFPASSRQLPQSPFFQSPEKAGIPPQPVIYPAAQPQQAAYQPMPVISYPGPTPGKKGGTGGWIAALLAGGGILLCLCASIGGIFALFAFPGTDTEKDLAATQIALAATREALTNSEGEVPAPEADIPPDEETTPEIEPLEPTEEATPAPVGPRTWLIMLYEDAEDDALEGGMFLDVNEAELVGSSDRVKIVTQFDRYKGAVDWDGDWTSTRRYYVGQDDNLIAIGSEMINDLGEMDMSDPNTLVDFVTWAVNTYPAEKYVLILSDHGDGWPGGWYDEDPNAKGHFLLNDLDSAFDYIRNQTGIDKFEIIGFDACLMAQLEVFSAVAPYAHYSIASEEVEPVFGWAYADFLSKLVENPDMDSDELVNIIIDGYIYQDQLVKNDELRTEIFGGASEKEVIAEKGKSITLSAIKLDAISAVNNALNDFVSTIQNVDQGAVAWSRTNGQHYHDIFMPEGSSLNDSSNIDLATFALLVKQQTGDPQVSEAADGLVNAIRAAVVAEKHGPEATGSNGISIYFPVSRLYRATYDDSYGFCYTCIANRFSQLSQWKDFLQYHYTNSSE